MIVVLMGVSGSGKTTIGTLLAQTAGSQFADADDFHPASNKAKMAAGHPLTDEDRQPWLERLNVLMRGWARQETVAKIAGVLACSALKEKYRATLNADMPEGTVQYVLLDGARELIATRLAARHHEFMTGALLESQLQTLEPPDEGLRVLNDRAPELVVQEILDRLAIQSA